MKFIRRSPVDSVSVVQWYVADVSGIVCSVSLHWLAATLSTVASVREIVCSPQILQK